MFNRKALKIQVIVRLFNTKAAKRPDIYLPWHWSTKTSVIKQKWMALIMFDTEHEGCW